MPLRKPVGAVLALVASALAGARAEAAPRYPADGLVEPPVPMRAVGWPLPCPGCRPAPPPCASGSRWYGPYGYVCYRPQPGPFLSQAYTGRR